VPYCTAISAHRDLADPHALAEDVLTDPHIRALAERMVLEPKRDGNTKGWGVDMTVTLRDGRSFDDVIDDFPGCPASSFSIDQLHRKFHALTRHAGSPSEEVFGTLLAIADRDNVRQLWSQK
jgi:2-methylcitrate dehydratase PrpD